MSMRSSVVDPSLLGSAASLPTGFVLRFPAKMSPPVKFGGQRLTVACSGSGSSSTFQFGRRELMYLATAPFLLSSLNSAFAANEDSLLKEELGKIISKGRAAGLLRLVFHDAGTFDQSDQTGGMNGSIILELNRPENKGLYNSLKVLEKAKDQVDAIQPVSWADVIAVAGAEAVLACGGPKITVKLGRIDATIPDPEGRLPEETLKATALKQQFQKKGFTTQELVALSGAHTLGNKGFGNPNVFDNSYYKILLEKPSGGMSDMIGLPSDRALIEDEECLRWISKYGNDQDLFFEDFKNAYTKLVNTGAKWKS